jgi:hypothetical protein
MQGEVARAAAAKAAVKIFAPFVGLLTIALSSGASGAPCAKINANALIDGIYAANFGCCKVITRPVDKRSNLRWVAVSWYGGPPDGRLFLLNCSGTKIAEANLGSLGYVERLRTVRSIGGIATVAATYISAWGTGIEDHSVALLQYRGGRIRVLWTHFVYGRWYPGKGMPDEEEHVSWRILHNGTRIEADTVHTIFRRHGRVRSRWVEHYCLRTSAWRFVSCK